MNCPLCLDQTLEIMHRRGVELDVCPKCRGIWLDRGELDRLASTAEPSRGGDSPPTEVSGGTKRDGRAKTKRKPKKKKRKKTLADRLGDALEDVLDL
jgi:Zn-finger nucleic acid-binding protein